MEIEERGEFFVISMKGQEKNFRLHADISIIKGRIWEASTQSWLIPKRERFAVGALIRRHLDRPQYHIEDHEGMPPFKAYQKEALEFVMHNCSALLDHCMGSGKTRTGIELIRLAQPSDVLIVGPTSALLVWEEQLEEYATYPYDLYVLRNGYPIKNRAAVVRAIFVDEEPNTDEFHPRIALVNYEAVWRLPLERVLRSVAWDLVICDEVHRLKSPGSKASRFFGRLAQDVPYRVGLSGTPLPHSILDVYGVYRFLQPSIFGTNFHKFRSYYANYDRMQHRVLEWRHTEEFRERYNLIRHHVPKESMEIEDAQINRMPVSLRPGIWKTYKSVEREFYAELEDSIINADNILVKNMRLQQIESEIVTTDDGGLKNLTPEGKHNAKQAALTEFLEDFPPEEKLVIFARFINEYEQIKRAGEEAGREVFMQTGQAKELVKWRDAEGGAILVVSLSSGTEASDMTEARYGIFYSLSWKLSEYEQAIARINRIGQRQAPVVYVMVPEGPMGQQSIGRKVFDAHKSRRSLIDALVGDARPSNDPKYRDPYVVTKGGKLRNRSRLDSTRGIAMP